MVPSPNQLHERRTPTQGTRRLCGLWVRYTKAKALYPPSNGRVRRLLEDFHAGLRELFSRHGLVRVEFHGDHARICGERVDAVGDTELQWLQERLDRCTLEGVEFTPEVETESLERFTERLHENLRSSSPARGFEDFWPVTYPGIRPLERLYLGIFRSGGKGTGDEELSAGSPQGRVLAELMASSTVLREQVAEVEELCARARSGESGDSGVAFDLTTELIQVLPAEALADGERLVETVKILLETLRSKLREEEGQVEGGEGVLGLMYRIGRKMFPRDMKPETPSFSRDSGGCASLERRVAEEDGIEEDLESLIREVERLPRGEEIGLEHDLPARLRESLGVHLTYLMTLEEGGALSRIPNSLAGILKHPRTEAGDLLRSFLEASEDPELFPHGDRLLLTLSGLGLLPLVRDCGYLKEERVERCFPSSSLNTSGASIRNPRMRSGNSRGSVPGSARSGSSNPLPS